MPTKLQRVIEALMETVIRTLIGTLLRNPYKDSLRIPVRVWGCGIRVEGGDGGDSSGFGFRAPGLGMLHRGWVVALGIGRQGFRILRSRAAGFFVRVSGLWVVVTASRAVLKSAGQCRV